MEKYYIMINGEQQGPFTAKEIEDKGFPSDSFIYNKGLGAWKKISEVTGFLSPNTEKDIKPEDTPKLTTDKSDFKSIKKEVGTSKNVETTNWYLKVLNHYADFNGRARRKEYWMFSLFRSIFIIAAMILDNSLEIAMDGTFAGPIYFVYLLVTFIPTTAVGVRRLHDVGKSGSWLLISFIPFIGTIWLFVLFVAAGNPGENEYGTNPKEMIV